MLLVQFDLLSMTIKEIVAVLIEQVPLPINIVSDCVEDYLLLRVCFEGNDLLVFKQQRRKLGMKWAFGDIG